MLSYLEVADKFNYDPLTGAITYKANIYDSIGRIRYKRGDAAVCLNRYSLVYVVKFNRVEYKVSRLAWAIYYCEEPPLVVRHLGDKLDNRICNLYNFHADKKSRLTFDNISQHFKYNQHSGDIFRHTHYYNLYKKLSPPVNNRGYYSTSVFGVEFLLHRLIWLLHYGYLPENKIDHISRNRLDNSIDNLREVSDTCNARNASLRVDNKTKVTGINIHPNTGSYIAKIRVSNEPIHLIATKDFTEAVAHRLAAEQALDWAGCYSNSTAYQYMQKYLKGLKNATDINSD